MRAIQLAGFILPILAISALGDDTYPKDVSVEARKHIIVVDSEGRPRLPIIYQASAGNYTTGVQPDYDIRLPKFVGDNEFRTQAGVADEDNRYKDYLRTMMDEIQKSHKTKIMIIVHGGMNFIDGAVARAAWSYHLIQDNSCYYPIFICWDSNPLSTYADGLVFNREGEYHREFPEAIYSWATMPLNLVGDIGRAAARAPAVFANQTYGDLQTVMPRAFAEEQRANQRIPYMDADHANGVTAWVGGRGSLVGDEAAKQSTKGRIQASVGQRKKATYENSWRGLSYAATLPLKLITAPVLDALGNKAWDQMYARIEMMFRSDSEYNFDDAESPVGESKWDFNGGYSPPRGAVATFIRALTKFQDGIKAAHARSVNKSEGDDSYMDVTLVGHSMGAIVINEIARYCNEQEDCWAPRNKSTNVNQESVDDDHLFVRNIVFFAAACTTREFESFTVPFIGRRLHRGEDVDFYTLSLHPQAELRETEAADIVPRGSLLVWIDNYFSNPKTFYDKTFGQFNNAVLSTQIIPPLLRDHVHLKAFKVGDAVVMPTLPQKHGDFLNLPDDDNCLIPYWTKPFWQAQAPVTP